MSNRLMRDRLLRPAAVAAAALLLASAACWGEIKEEPTTDSVGAYEPAAGAGAAPTGGPVPVPTDTGRPPPIPPASGRDTTSATPPPR